jgi:hypothetical protein
MNREEIWLVEPADGLLELYVNELKFELHEANGKRVCKRRV